VSLDYVDTLRALLKAYLSEGYPSARFAASLIDTSERTLARRLSGCGLTYGALVDEVRFTVAKDLLAEPDARIVDVGRAVGFDDQSHFTRMCRRIGGLTPNQMRKAARTSAANG
jgi:AraC-like DNA-binding protein